MFPIGHKLIVIASSTTKLGTNIRKGSLGYLSSIGDTKLFDKQSIFMTPAKVVFTRYGYEKKRRCELKFVVLVHPSQLPKNIKNPQYYLNNIARNSLDMNSQLRQLFKIEGVDIHKVTAIVVTPTLLETNIEANLLEFKSWVLSVMHSGVIHQLVTLNKNNPLNIARLKLIINIPKFKLNMYKCLKFKGASDKLCEELFYNSTHRNSMVKQFKEYLYLQVMKNIHTALDKLDNPWSTKQTVFKNIQTLYNNGCSKIVLPKKKHSNYSYTNEIILKWNEKFKELKQ